MINSELCRQTFCSRGCEMICYIFVIVSCITEIVIALLSYDAIIYIVLTVYMYYDVLLELVPRW